MGSTLYLGDNVGDILFDRLLIKTINHPNLIFVTRRYPVSNDIPIEDAQQVGLDTSCSVIPKAYEAPLILLEFCFQEFLEAYNKAGLILSKGQGNFKV